ncbi:hypothetical protein HK097_000833 [Rhizophlyctis rosea]|uniref:25S rRNA (uridine-N(3))-methyltransferase BMT5-like domain-containing protein n=1 Tax=Rhizophlyctis rosea TaxID=64517 RepID=A0AAD5S545_9FUNG|nr:hypothetical protein HK097_000833 [Rhizophlyctis rosea]
MGKKGPRSKGRSPSSSQTFSRPPSSQFTNFGNLSTADLLHLTLSTSTSPKTRTLSRFSASHRILLIGEGDFTFALALSTALGSGKLITATSFDTLSDASKKYPSVSHTLSSLKSSGATILHSIDARSLSQNPKLLSLPSPRQPATFDRIIFNFPHIGGSQTTDILENQSLLSQFFSSSLPLLTPSAEIHVALRDTPFYAKWEIQALAREEGLKLKEKVPFEAELFGSLGYTVQRTKPAVRAAPTLENASVYVFGVGEGKKARKAVSADGVGKSEKAVSGGADAEGGGAVSVGSKWAVGTGPSKSLKSKGGAKTVVLAKGKVSKGKVEKPRTVKRKPSTIKKR